MINSALTELDWIVGKTIIKFTQADPALLMVDAIVEEQDTNLILGQTPVAMATIESFPALVKKMEQQIVERPGNVIVRRSRPRRFIAIVYDVDHTPICEMQWIEKALKKILEQCEQYKINTLAMPLLGMNYGKLQGEMIMQLLQDLLMNHQQQYLKRIIIYKHQIT